MRSCLYVLLAVSFFTATTSYADEPRADATRNLSLADALATFHARSFDLNAARAAVSGAQGDATAAGQVENPQLTASYTHVFNYRADGQAPILGPCITCREGGPNFGINDQAALIHTLTGERSVRVRVAEAALRAAQLQKDDAIRTLDFQLKSQYVQVLAAQEALRFARESSAFAQKMADLGRARHPGVIDDGDLARLESDALRAQLAVTAADSALQGEMAGLTFLLDDRDPNSTYRLDADEFKFRVPQAVANPDLRGLVTRALATRPDLRSASVVVEQLKAAASLAKYQLIPDAQVFALYVEQGVAQNTATPPMITIGIQTQLPIFYQQEGEIHRAQANLSGQEATLDRATAQVIEDVRLAYSNFFAARQTAEVMETQLLDKSRKSRDVAEIKFREGSSELIDLLDAERQYTAVTQEYVQDLLNYWNAVFALEEAVGVDLRS